MWKDWNIKDLETTEGKNGLKVFSCFACGGGSSMGYKRAGYSVIGVNEIDPELTAIYSKNFPKVKIINMPIQELVSKKAYPPEIYDIDVLDGSPPCSSFSMAGNREKDWQKDKKFREGQAVQVLDDLFFWFIKVAKEIRPKVVISENVKGMISGSAKGYVSEVFRQFDEAGYDTQLFLLNSASMGVPQKRQRVFFISRRKDLNLPKINLSFNEPPITFKELRKGDGVKKNMTEMEDMLLKNAKPSDSDLACINERIRNKRIGFTMKIVRDEQVCFTISSGGAMYSYQEKRHLTANELIRIQSFPLDYDFGRNDYSHIKYILGMSVPPIMMQKVAEQVAKQIFGLSPTPSVI